MSERQPAENDAHAPELYGERLVCACGDFDCASLYRVTPPESSTP